MILPATVIVRAIAEALDRIVKDPELLLVFFTIRLPPIVISEAIDSIDAAADAAG